MRTLLKDLRYAARVLRKSPGFTAVAVIAVALGVGANTAIFSVVNAVLLRTLNYKEPGQLVLINHNYPKIDLKASVSTPGYNYYHENAKSFSDMAAATGWSVNLTGEGEPERLQGGAVTHNLFAVLGTEAAEGRTFTPEEGQVGNNKVVVLGNAFWKRRFGGVPVVGKNLMLNGEPYAVVGVMPPAVEFGREWSGQAPDLWSPLA